MLKIIQHSENIIQISNGRISLKFYKTGHSQGFFEVIFLDKIALKECYSNIIFHGVDCDELIEIKSTQSSYSSIIDHKSSESGKILTIILSPLQKEKLELLFNIQIQLFEDQDYFLISLEMIKDSAEIKRPVHSISPFTVKNNKLWLNGIDSPTNLENITWFKNGFQSWSPCRLFFGTEKDVMGPSTEVFNLTFDNQDYHIQGRFYSEYNTVITDLISTNSLILGFITNQEQFTRIVMDYENAHELKKLTAFGCMDGVKFQETDINSSETLYIGFKTQNRGYYGLLDYAKVVKSTINKSLITKIPVGWCSWYYYFTDVTESEIINNLNFFTSNEDIPIDFIQLDDGYFTKVGDYLNIDKQKFPNGLEYLFSEIKNCGFKTGIWIAPFFAIRTSKLFKTHRNWFLKRKNKPLKVHFNWNSFQYALDLTRDEVLNYLAELFSNFYHINKNMTMDFFKIDFLHAAVPYDAGYRNNNLTRAQLLYQGIKRIRETITPKSFLLGCGAPLGPCIGLVDAMRISGDTAPIWDAGYTEQYSNNKGIENASLKSALINILYRSFMHKYFWINDPDCLMIRRTKTNLSLDEIRLQMTIFGLSGGQLLISDDMTILSDDEIHDAKLLIPPYNPKSFDPIVIDAFHRSLPTVYMLETLEIIGHRYLVAIINWNDRPINRKIEVSELLGNKSGVETKYLIFSFWDKTYLGLYDLKDTLNISNIRPHSCAYLSIIPVNKDFQNETIFISSDLHIAQGCHEVRSFEVFQDDEDNSKISLGIQTPGKRSGKIYLKIPLNRQVIEYASNYEQVNEKVNIWKFEVEVENRHNIEILVS